MAILLVIGFIEWIQQPDYGLLDMVGLFVQQISIGVAVGLAVGFAAVWAFRRVDFATGGLYPVASIAAAALAFGAADSLHGSGFLAVYLAGLVLGSSHDPGAQHDHRVPPGPRVGGADRPLPRRSACSSSPASSTTSGSRAPCWPSCWCSWPGPLAAAVATAFDRFSAAERFALGWAGLRGGVPVVLATFPVIEGVPDSREFFNIAFFAVVLSTVLQGSTFEPLAKALGLTTDEPALPRPIAESGTIRRLGAEVVEFPVARLGRRGGPLRARPRPAARRAAERDRQARRGDPAARLDADRGGRPPARAACARRWRAQFPALMERWREGPFEPEAVRRPHVRGGSVIFSTRPWEERDGDPALPARRSRAAA